MAEEQLYTAEGAKATPAERVTLANAGLLERQHPQEWVIAHPEILGEEVLVVTFEFDRWATSAGTPTWERLDVLALDRAGRLIVAELKRDVAPDAVMVQALNYAAMARGFSLDQLVEAYGAFRGGQLTAAELQEELREWAPTVSDETLGPPRIVLVAEDFGPVLRNTAMFLIESGLDLRLVRVQLYRMTNDTLALTVSQLLPVPDTEEFMVRPRSAASTQRAARLLRHWRRRARPRCRPGSGRMPASTGRCGSGYSSKIGARSGSACPTSRAKLASRCRSPRVCTWRTGTATKAAPWCGPSSMPAGMPLGST